MRKATLLLPLLLLAATTFAGVEFFASTTKKFSRVKEKTVALMQQAPAGAEAIGTIIATTKNEIQAITVAKKVASRNGGNILVIQQEKDMAASGQVANRMLHAGVRGKYVFAVYRLPAQE